MYALFVFGLILFASPVLSSPYPTTTDDAANGGRLDDYFDEWRKHFPEIKVTPPKPFDFPVMKDPFAMDENDGFGGIIMPKRPLWPSFKFSDDFFKNIREDFENNTKNGTVENVKEVDGHIIHEKESTFSNGDENHRVVFRAKTVIIRPKKTDEKVDAKVGTDDQPSFDNQKPVHVLPRSNELPAGTSNRNNPNDDVEMIHRPIRAHPNAALQNRLPNAAHDEIVYDLSNDTRINDYYKGPINPDAEMVDLSSKKNFQENPNAPIREVISNDLDESNQSEGSLEHDMDVNKKTSHSTTEEAAEIFDTNAIRIKRRNKYTHYYT